MVQQQEHYYYGTGKRKTSIARVKVYSGEGGVVINGKPLEEVFPWEPWQKLVLEPLKVTDTTKQFHVIAAVQGGGTVSQASAVKHGISRALALIDPNLRQALKRHGLLTRDARIKESKKYGLRGARKAKQYTKR